MPVEMVTFGCRLNAYESEVMHAHATAAGLADAVVIHTCAVTAQAEKQARQAIRKARRAHPQRPIIVTGCAAQIHPQQYSAMPEVDLVLGNEEKLQPQRWAAHAGLLAGAQGGAQVEVGDIAAVRETAAHLLDHASSRARAFLQVQNGCDHRCTFCIIPFGRGPSRSVPMGEIVARMRALVAAGYHEIVLTGVDLTDYGRDLPGQPRLGQMIRRALASVPQLPRLRLSSIDAAEIDDDLWQLIAHEPRLMPHLHLSLQAGDDLILKRMKRRHSRDDILRCCDRARALRPQIAFGADIIAGFPTETEEMFSRTARLVEEAGLTYLHVFPYSARTGTPAARMPQVPLAQRKARAATLRALGAAQVARHHAALVGMQASIVVEQDGQSGHSECFARVRLARPAPVGSLLRAPIVAADADAVYAA